MEQLADREFTSDPADYAPGTFGCHEAMHECSLYAGLLSDFSDHPAIEANADWKLTANVIAEKLVELYQKIASAHFGAIGDDGHSRASARA